MCEKPIYLKSKNMLVGCGRCPECRKKRSREIYFRLACELSYSPALFLTLTFDDDHLGDNILNVRDLQLFIKRLRKALPDRKIKYYSVGEYGDTFGRKHYHSVMFNVTYSDSEIIQKCWKYGDVDIAPVESGSISYVAGYVDKKLYGDDLEEFIEAGIKAPFSVCSRKLGYEFIKRNWEQLCNDKHIKIGDKIYPIPRYFRRLLGLTFDNEEYKDYIKNFHKEIVEKSFEQSKASTYMLDDDFRRLYELFEYDFVSEDHPEESFELLSKEFRNCFVLGKVKCDRKRLKLSRTIRDTIK